MDMQLSMGILRVEVILPMDMQLSIGILRVIIIQLSVLGRDRVSRREPIILLSVLVLK
jgi:hypothetical protein